MILIEHDDDDDDDIDNDDDNNEGLEKDELPFEWQLIQFQIMLKFLRYTLPNVLYWFVMTWYLMHMFYWFFTIDVLNISTVEVETTTQISYPNDRPRTEMKQSGIL